MSGATQPSLDEYGAAAKAAYTLTRPGGLVSPPGWTVLLQSKASLQAQDGFGAVALRDPAGNIIIAYEGTEPNCTPYGKAAANADYILAQGTLPPALSDAAKFARDVMMQFGNGQPIYVTGHSLGATEAQAACKALGSGCAGGAGFAGTGLPGNTDAGNQGFVNYIERGDPVGNWASDAASPLADVAPANMTHYGSVQYIGSQWAGADLAAIGQEYQSGLIVNPFTLGGDAAALAVHIYLFHDLYKAYGADLNLQSLSTPLPPVLGLQCIGVIGEFLELAGNGPAAAPSGQATIQDPGIMTTPGFTLAIDPSGSGLDLTQTVLTGTYQGTWASVTRFDTTDSSVLALTERSGVSMPTFSAGADSFVVGAGTGDITLRNIAAPDASGMTPVISLQTDMSTQSGFVIQALDAITLSLTGRNDNATLVANCALTLTGTGNAVTASSGDSVSVSGGGNTINGIGASIALYLALTNGAYDIVSATGDVAGGNAANGQASGIVVAPGAQANITGSNDGITLSAGDSVGVFGGYNVISNVGAYTVLYLASTDGQLDIVHANGVATGTLTSNGQPSGILMAPGAQANIYGGGQRDHRRHRRQPGRVRGLQQRRQRRRKIWTPRPTPRMRCRDARRAAGETHHKGPASQRESRRTFEFR